MAIHGLCLEIAIVSSAAFSNREVTDSESELLTKYIIPFNELNYMISYIIGLSGIGDCVGYSRRREC